MSLPKADIEVSNKYKLTAQLLNGRSGSLMDIGARDRVLKKYLPNSFDYKSADYEPGCDLQIDLEQPLAMADSSLDYVVALDVLEHLENPHRVMAELVRVAKQGLVVALPCMASLQRRLRFLVAGDLATDKYQLGAQHPGDRHRWLTVYSDILTFYQAMADQHGLQIVALKAEMGPGRFWGALGYGLCKIGLPPALFADRLIVSFKKA